VKLVGREREAVASRPDAASTVVEPEGSHEVAGLQPERVQVAREVAGEALTVEGGEP